MDCEKLRLWRRKGKSILVLSKIRAEKFFKKPKEKIHIGR